MKDDEIRTQRLSWAVVAGIGALLLASGLLLLLSRFQVQAQPAAAIAADDFLVSKEVNTGLAAPGDTLHYTITVQDTGNHPPMMVRLTDTLPAELSYLTDTLSCPSYGSDCGVEGDVITWTAQMYGGGQTTYIYFSADITSDITCATVVNTARVTTGTAVIEASATTVVAGDIGNLVVTKAASESTVEPGDIVTYTISVEDAGIPSGIVWLSDTLPAELSYITGSLSCPFYGGSCDIENGVITWTAQMHGGHQTANINFSAQISPGITSNQWVINTVDVNALCQSRIASAGVYVYLGTPILGMQKTVYPERVRLDGSLTYTVLISNTGDGVAKTIWMTDELPAEVDYATGLSATSGMWGVAGDVITWTGSLDPAEGVTITFGTSIASTVANDTRFANTAQVVGMGGPVSASVEARAITTFTTRLPLIRKYFPPVSTLNPIPTPDENNAYVVSWQSVNGATHYVLQESEDANFASPSTWQTTQTSQPFDKSMDAGTFYYRVRPDGPWGAGAWSNVESVTIYPPKAVLNAIPTPDANNSYDVSWQLVTGAYYYILQESQDDASFGNPAGLQTTQTSQSFTKSASGTFYYRVRADGPWGEGLWSDVQSVTVYIDPGFFDDFSNSNSGWPIVRNLVIDEETKSYYKTRYENDQYRIMVDPGGPDIWFHQPDALAPYQVTTDKYCVEVKSFLAKNQAPYVGWDFYPWWANGGLVFGANDANTNIYAVCVAVGADSMGWFAVNNPDYKYPKLGCNASGDEDRPGEGGGLAYGQWHTFHIGVDGDHIKVWVDRVYKGRFKMSGLSAMTRVGLIGGDYEMNPVDFRFDDFRVTPNKDCSP